MKPDHFYNVRVIAVGSNNFQAGSRVIRLRTFGRDGRPQIGNSRLPSNFAADEPHGSAPSEIGDEAGGSRTSFPALEAATPSDGIGAPVQDRGSVAPSGPRRNTVTRRHSPSTTSLDQPIRDEVNAHASKTLPELTEQFESIRKETEDVMTLIAKEEADNRVLLEELEAEKREKKKEQKKKEEQTEKLKRDVNSTDRTMRNAMQRKAQREKLLREKQNERSKFHDSIAKWDKGVEDMRGNRESFDQQRTGLEEERDRKVECLRGDNDGLHAECSRLEAELREKREMVRELEEARKKLQGGGDDSEWQEKDEAFKREWARRQRELQEALALEAKRARELDQEFRILTMQLQANPHAAYAIFSQANTPGLEFDNPAFAQSRRRSRPSNSLSNASVSTTLPTYSQIDPAMSAPTGFASSRSANAPPGFAPGPFMLDLLADIPGRPELSNRAAPAPLSPSATALLPSNILADLDDDEPSSTARFGHDPFMPQQRASPEDVPLSPASSGKSFSIFSSPHGSSNNLPFPPFSNDASDRMSLNAAAAVPSPIAAEPPPNKLGSFFSFQRSRPAKVMEKEGPLLGSLKQGQSQSFPRQTDEDGLMNKRRISLSGTWNVFNRNSAGPEITEGHGTNPRMFSRNLNPFSSSHRPAGGLFPERDPSSPRPASIASSEFPRPSTDSSSIWGPPPDPAALGKPSRLWSPDAAWSRNASRRPSLHGSPSALKTTLASADDEILGEEMLPNVREVGVIGSRPPAQSSKPLGRLNPNAPAFIGSFFKSKPDREKDKEGKEKTKAEKKDRSKAKDSKEKPKSKEPASTPETSQAPSIELESPSESRKSRDGISVHTLASVSESRDSLSLDQSFSNTPSEPTSAGLPGSFKEDNVVRKLFRKSSSSKFSFAGRLGGKESGLFKKGPSSTTSGGASDKGTSIERTSIGDFDDIADEIPNPGFLGRSYDSVTSSPSLGPTSNAKNKENKATVRWLSNFKKGKKEKESLELDRSQFSELDGLSEEGSKN